MLALCAAEALIYEEKITTSTIEPRAGLDQAIHTGICDQLLEIDRHRLTHHNVRARMDTLIANLNDGRLTKEQKFF